MLKRLNNLDFKKKILISIALFIFILAFLMLFNIDFSKTDSDYHLVCSYPPRGTEYLAIMGVILLSGYVYLLNLFFVDKLTGLKKILVIILIVVLFFLILEGVLTRYAKKHDKIDFRPHPLLLWVRSRPVNSMGFVYDEFPIKKEPNEFRFILVGDSTAEGNKGTRFSEKTEQALQKLHPNKKIRVVNAACSGYSIVQVKHLMDLKLKKLNPDYLIISLNNDSTYDNDEDKNRLPKSSMVPILNALYKSNLYLMFRKYKLNKDYHKYEKSIGSQTRNDKRRVSREDVKKYYGDVINTAKDMGTGVIIMAMPSNYKKKEYDHQDFLYKKGLRRIAENHNVLFCDIYSKWKESDSEYLFEDYVHPTTKGHKMIADELIEFIEKEKIIK